MNLTFEPKEDYLYVKISGGFDNDKIYSMLDKIFNECRNCDYSKMLLDALDIELEPVKIFDRYHVGLKIAELSTKSRLIRVGCIVRKQYFDGISVLVANNRGAQFNAFHDKDYALDWLLSR